VKRSNINAVVLVGVLKDARDLGILLNEKWYRIPVKDAPVRAFRYLAFYQPAVFGRTGKRIRYYAEVLGHRRVKRRTILPDEAKHPRAGEWYYQFRLGKIKRLSRPILNITPRRVTFGFTTLHRLLTSKDILELYDVVPTEQIIKDALGRLKVTAIPQYYVTDPPKRGEDCPDSRGGGRKRYFLDFAVFCRRGSIAVECDNTKAHSGRRRLNMDKQKDAFLMKRGWVVIRLREDELIDNLAACLARIRQAIRKLGGQQK